MPLIWHKLVAVNIWKREIKFRPMPLQLNWLKECLHSDTYNFPSTQSNSLYQWTSSGHFGQAGFMLKRVSAYMCTFSKAAPILAARQRWVCVLPLPFFFCLALEQDAPMVVVFLRSNVAVRCTAAGVVIDCISSLCSSQTSRNGWSFPYSSSKAWQIVVQVWRVPHIPNCGFI